MNKKTSEKKQPAAKPQTFGMLVVQSCYAFVCVKYKYCGTYLHSMKCFILQAILSNHRRPRHQNHQLRRCKALQSPQASQV
jgi:hypothetical protein